MATTPRINLGEAAASAVKRLVGSWRYVLSFNAGFFGWILINHFEGTHAFDHYPYILLNLVLSFLAGVTGPLIMVSQNHQEVIQGQMLKTILHLAESHRELLRGHKIQLDYLIDGNREILEAIDELDDDETP